eukprot:12270443-Heterocapsa_arctica.AAC.1
MPTPEEVNAKAENQRFRQDSSFQWRRTGAKVWNGMPDPCGCGAFVYAHFHGTGGSQKEREDCPPEQAMPFWERVMEENLRKEAEEEASMVEEVLRARQE